jgi:hypothetical protein
VNRYEVGLSEELIQRCEFDVLSFHILDVEWIVVDNLHVETHGPLHHRSSYSAHTYYTEGLPVDVTPYEHPRPPGVDPFLSPDVAISLCYPSGRGHHQGEGTVCSCLSEDAGRICNEYASFSRLSHVYVVESYGIVADYLQLLATIHDF